MRMRIVLVCLAIVAFADAASAQDLRTEIDAALAVPPGDARLERYPTDEHLVGGAAADDCCPDVKDYCAPEDPCKPWNVELILGFSLAQGNSDLLNFTFDGRADYEKGPWAIGNLVQFVYGENAGVRSAENWRTKHRVDRKFSDTSKTYAFGQLLFNRDELSGLEYRFTPTVGIGRTLMQGNRGFLKGEIGGGAVHEKRLGMGATTAPSAYLGLDMERNWRDGKKIVVDYDFVANLDDVGLSFWTLDTKFFVPVCAWMDLTVGVRLDYVFEPPGGAESLDVLTVVGLNVRLSDI